MFLILLVPSLFFGRDIKTIKKSGKIYAAFTESARKSLNYKLALEFAKFLNVKLEVVNTTWNDNFSRKGKIPDNYQTNPNVSYTPDALRRADFICGTIYVLEWRKKFFDYAGILDLSDLLIVPKSNKSLKSYEELKGLTIGFLSNSSYETHIKSINNLVDGKIKFKTTSSEEQSQKLLKQGRIDGFITVSYLALEFVKHNPDYKIAFPVSPVKKIGWAVENDNEGLREEIENFYATLKGSGKLDRIFIEHFGMSYSKYLEIISAYSSVQKSNGYTKDLDEILESGEIIVAFQHKTMVYDSVNKQFNQHIAEEFAKYIGVKLKTVIVDDFSRYFENPHGEIIKDSAYTPEIFKNIDVICENMVPTKWRKNKLDIISFMPYAQVIIGRKNTKINSINDLKKYKGVVEKGSMQEDILIKNHFDNYIIEPNSKHIEAILSGKVDYIIGSSFVFELSKYPLLEAKFVIGDIGLDGWAIKKNQPKLRQKILEFLEYARKKSILDKYFKIQTGMTLNAAINYLTALHETYQSGIFPFVFYGTNEGLPQEDVLAIYQDHENYMWFGTHSGVTKYNGRQMKTFNTGAGMSNNSVFDIAQDKKGNMYFATFKGISILKNGKMTTMFSNMSFEKIFIDKNNTKWFYGDYGIVTLDRNDNQKFLNNENLNIPQYINSIHQDYSKKITYVASDYGFYYLNRHDEIFKISDIPCYAVFIDEENQLWISSKKGIHIVDLAKYKKDNLGNLINKQLNISVNTKINKITRTVDGSVWLLSDHKIYKILTITQKPIIYDSRIGLQKQKILSFIEDKEKNYWFGYSGGIQKLTTRSLRTLFPSIINNYVSSIIEDSKERVWISVNDNVFYIKDKLVNYTELFSKSDESYVVGLKSNGNIIIASTNNLYEIDKNSLGIVKTITFKRPLDYIKSIFISSKDEIFLLTGGNGIVYYFKNFDKQVSELSNLSTTMISQLVEYEDMIVGANSTGLVFFDGNDFDRLEDIENIIWSLYSDKDTLWVGTENGIAIYKDYIEYIKTGLPNNIINAIQKSTDANYLWIGTNQGFSYFNKKTKKVEFSIDARDGLLGNEISINGLKVDSKGLLWIGTFHGVATFDIKKIISEKFTPECKIEKIILNGQEIPKLNSVLKHYENNLLFELTALSFTDEKSVEYEFYMKGLENDFAASKGKEHKANYTNLPPGKYQFVFRTKGKDGIWSYYNHIEFEILKPFWREVWFIATVILLLIFVIWLIMKWRSKALRKKNEQLEEIVKQRTYEVVKQNSEILEKNEELNQQKEEITTQRDEIEKQRDLAQEQRDEISNQKKDITDSITYASRIQTAILPPSEYIESVIPNHFILYKPRDIVSGDYYWMKQIDNKVYIIAADCTGHGVPGAFMSMLGSAFLSDIISKVEEEEITTGGILDELRQHVITALHQTGGENETKDGMDVAFCMIDFEAKILEFSGALNPLYFIREGELTVYKGDRMPIGISDRMNEKFSTNRIELKEGDTFYISSDGYADQFGGPRGKKFMTKNYKKLLVDINNNTMEEQKEILVDRIGSWQGDLEQVDDIIVIGMRI